MTASTASTGRREHASAPGAASGRAICGTTQTKASSATAAAMATHAGRLPGSPPRG